MTKEALKLALEALEQLQGGCTDHDDGTVEAITVWCPEVIDAIKEALAAPVQEPVAWMHLMDNTEGIKANGKGIVSITQKRKHPFGKPGVDFSKSYPVTSTPLYTTPPAAQRQWVGLTKDEVLAIGRELGWRCRLGGNPDIDFDYAKAIEAKLKEKNT